MCFSIPKEGSEDCHLAWFAAIMFLLLFQKWSRKLLLLPYCPTAHATSSPWEENRLFLEILFRHFCHYLLRAFPFFPLTNPCSVMVEETFPISMKSQLLLYPFIISLHLILSQDSNEINDVYAYMSCNFKFLSKVFSLLLLSFNSVPNTMLTRPGKKVVLIPFY